MNVINPAFADLIDEGIIEAARAQRHLAEMSRDRRAQLEKEWAMPAARAASPSDLSPCGSSQSGITIAGDE